MELSVFIMAEGPAALRELRGRVEEAGLSCVGELCGLEGALERIGEVKPDLVLITDRPASSDGGGELVNRLQGTHVVPVVVFFEKGDLLLQQKLLGRLQPYGFLMGAPDRDHFVNTLRAAVRNFRSKAGLLLKRDLLDGLLHTASEGFLLLDEEGRFLEVNDAYCGMVEMGREALLSKTIFDVDVEGDEACLREYAARCAREGRITIQRRHRTGKGESVDLLANVSAIDTLEGTFFGVFCRDITEQLKREALMRLQTSALASAANAVVITDTEGLVVWANRAFSKVTGYAAEEAIGRTPGQLLKSGMHDDAFYEEMWATISGGEAWNGEIQNRRKDGSLFTEDMTITPLFDASGAITHYISIKQDITEQKKLERMLRRAQRLESIGTLASGVAHDLNNVLSPVIMSADLLKMKLQDPDHLELVTMMKDGAVRGADIIRRLLSFARGSDAPFAPVQVRALLNELCKVMRETFPRHIQIEADFGASLPEVFGDPTQLHQVFTNLMINARDAMPEGGRLSVEAEPRSVSEAWAEAHPPARAGEYLCVRVRDSGTGMSEEVMERIFDPFFSTKAPGKGTGLGLSTSLGILHAHKGFLETSSEVGKGSVFEVYLPLASEKGGRKRVARRELPPGGTSERILVVDDEEAVRFMLKGTLESLSYRVELVEDGRAALQRLEEARGDFDLIVLDMMMPGMDGAGFLKEARARSSRLPPVLVISGMVEGAQLESTGLDLNTCFLAKPFTIQELAVKIRGVLDSGGGRT